MDKVRVVKPAPAGEGRQGMMRMIGVSVETTQSKNLFMSVQRVPPGGRTLVHRHTNCETASYNLSGTVRVYSGEDLDEVQVAGPGDFMYIPANAWHVIENASQSEWVEAVIARNAAEEVVEERRPLSEPSHAAQGRGPSA